MLNWELYFDGMRCSKVNEAMLILCRIAIAQAGKPYRKDTPRQLPIWIDCVRVFYIRVRLHFTLIGGNLTAQSTGGHREIGGGIQIPKA